MFASWEESFRGSLSLALQIGYSVHAKVSLNRILARPPMALDDPDAYAILRGDSLDFAIVRDRDGKIMAALEVDSGIPLSEEHKAARTIRTAMLQRAGVKTIPMKADDGPSAIREALAGLVKPESTHVEFGTELERQRIKG